MATVRYRPPLGAVFQPIAPVSKDREGPKLAVCRTEAAEMLSVCVKTLDRLVSEGKIHSVKVCRRRIFPVQDILAWLQKNASGPSLERSTATNEGPLPLTVNRQEAARLISVGVRLLDEIVASGALPKIQITRKLIFRTADLVDWLRRQSASVIAD